MSEMEKQILEFILECQKNIVNIQIQGNLKKLLILQSLLSVNYLIEQYQQAIEAETSKQEQLQQELSELRILYNNANSEILQVKRLHQEHLEELAKFEVKVIENEEQIKQKQEDEIFMMKSNHRDMIASLKLQNQYIQEVTQKNENQQQEINDLMKKIVSLKNCQTDLNTDLNNSIIISQQQSLKEIKNDIKESIEEETLPLQIGNQSVFEIPTKQNSSSNMKNYFNISAKSLKYIQCHSKNQSLNWVKLATIVQSLKSQQQSTSNTQTQLKEQDRLSKDLSTCEFTPYSFNSRNPYEIFFSLQCQCVKLDLNRNQYYLVNVNHLYQEFIVNSVPFHKWYSKIKHYILGQQH